MQITALGHLPLDPTTQDILAELTRLRGVGETTTLPPLPDLIRELELSEPALITAKKLVAQAIAAGQNICVYGDYDADGITATAIMWLTLVGLGARVLPFIPSRTRHGYGLSDASVSELLSGQGFASSQYPDFIPDLILTVDNGIVAGSQIQTLRAAGKTVIITDHHTPSGDLPACDALLHTTLTSGAGISWVVSRYLANDATFAQERIDLATIGIVADQMPVVGVNRAIIKAGLKQIEQTNLLGLRTILEHAGIANRALTTYDLNFILAPRINAVGRLDDALLALRLLCTSKSDLAQKLSLSMEALNKERQALTDTAIQDALKHIGTDKIIIVASPDYHHGVIGLIAGKLAEQSGRPAIAMSIDGAQVKGSARSVAGVNVTELLRRHAGLLSSVGGHPQAAGFSLPQANLDEFMDAIRQDANTNIDASLLADTLQVDLELPLNLTTLNLAQALTQLEPYGLGNPKPRFVAHKLQILEDRSLGEGGKHHKLQVEEDGVSRTVLWFNGQPATGTIQDLVYTVAINTWQNRKELQLMAAYVGL